MPMSICRNGHLQRWRNQRGVSLKDLRCVDCGSPMHRAEYIDGQWVRARKRIRRFCETHRRHYYEPGGCWRCRADNHRPGLEADK